MVQARMVHQGLISLVSRNTGNLDMFRVDRCRDSLVRASMGLVILVLASMDNLGLCSLGQANQPHGSRKLVNMVREWELLVKDSVHLLCLGLLSLGLGGLGKGRLHHGCLGLASMCRD